MVRDYMQGTARRWVFLLQKKKKKKKTLGVAAK
jgi:hypothetical protein